jgi:short-subunit dehydrogenase
VIVTGASSGIGAATAVAFAQSGASVTLAARSAERLAEVVRDMAAPDRTLVLPADVTRSEDCERLARLTAERFGRVDVLVNNAGIGHWTTFEELTEAEARRIVEVNVLGVMNAARAVLPWMKKQRRGVIINLASTVGHMGMPMMSVYCATKFAVRGFSQSLRLELARDGIRVVCFCPGYTDTEFFQRAIVRERQWRHGLCLPMKVEAVAQRIVAVAARPRSEVVLTWEGRLLAWSSRHLPRLTAWAVRQFFKA